MFSAMVFLYFPLETFWRWKNGTLIVWNDVVADVVLPLTLLIGLIRVSRVGWYTLIALTALWGVRDLADYYSLQTQSVLPLLIHVGIYCFSLAYFINPRVRHLYFDPKLRWWRTKPRYETHLPFIMGYGKQWHYPILRNISDGGCFIETSHLLEVSDTMQITIPLPVPLNVSVIQTEGEVRWLSQNPLRYGMGVQFKNVSAETATALGQYVARQL
jgi:hypothetical protein